MHIPAAAAAEPKQNRIDDAGAWKKNCKKGQFVSSCNSMHSPICPLGPSLVSTRLLILLVAILVNRDIGKSPSPNIAVF